MKYFLIILCFTAFLSCKKDEEEPPVEPDFAPDLAGTYIGHESQASPNVGNTTYDNASKTLTVTIRNKNEILVSSFNGGSSMNFTLSDGGSAKVLLDPSDPRETYGPSSNNSYIPVDRELRIYFKNPATSTYYFFQGIKQ